MPKLLGIDVGTSGCKVLLVNETGSILAQASAEYPISSPRAGWSEQEPMDWWLGVVSCLDQIGERRPDAIGVTGQMHGSVFLDERGEVVRPAILWNDQRTVLECEQMEEAVGRERLRAITCNPPLTGFQVPKLLWIRNNESTSYQRVRKLLLPKDYLRFLLSGQFASEVSDASGTGVFDVPRRTWSEEMLERLEIPSSLLPECTESDVATTKTRVGGWFEPGIPIMGGGGDQAAAAVGTGAVKPGITSVSLGTSGVVFTSLSEPRFHPEGMTHTFCHANRAWHAMGVMLSCGGALRWFRDSMAPGSSYDTLGELAGRSAPGANGITFLPYLTGERCPFIDPSATASFSGLSLGHTVSDLSRSVFEAATVGLVEAFELLKSLGAQGAEVRVTGGGAKSSFWMQLLADMFEHPCFTLEVDEGPAFGAALLAGVGVGVWPDVTAAAAETVKLSQRFSPQFNFDYRPIRERSRTIYNKLRGRAYPK